MQSKLVFQPKFSELEISASKVIRMVGGGDESALRVMNEDLKFMFFEAEKRYDPFAYIYTQKLYSVDVKDGLIRCQKEFEVGSKIAKYFEGAESIAIFVCTIGDKIENWSRELLEKGDYLKAYMVDALGSLAVEILMDLFQEKLKGQMKSEGLNITNRYSPGYCDWDVSEQQKLFSLLPKGFNAVSLSESSLMHPMKSVSGFIGIGSRVAFSAYRCKDCNSVDCAYRNKK